MCVTEEGLYALFGGWSVQFKILITFIVSHGFISVHKKHKNTVYFALFHLLSVEKTTLIELCL